MHTLIHAHVYLQGHNFDTFELTHDLTMKLLFAIVQGWFEGASILNISRDTPAKLEELTDFDEIYAGVAMIDQKHV